MSRRSNWWDWGSTPDGPIPVVGGIKARSTRGKIGDTWWSQHWLNSLDISSIGDRLARGKTYARKGQVFSLQISPGKAEAFVQGARTRPYRVSVKVKAISNRDWARVYALMSQQASTAAQLLAGEMPADIEDIFTKAGVSLFPQSPDDISTNCSCPDWVNPCKHVAAVCLIMAEQFDRDPFMLFTLRGRTAADTVKALRDARHDASETRKSAEPGPDLGADNDRGCPADGGTAAIAEIPPIESRLSDFWLMGSDLTEATAQVAAQSLAAKDPTTIIRLMGPPPFGEGASSLPEALARGYQAVSHAARALSGHRDRT
ncbi:MAG: SWIM zinc finger family protein [Clostridia bacterium]|nr:SWIM zinc finger family protein [Clostridia bacterium]